MRYVLLPDSPTLADIDQALEVLRAKQRLTSLPCVKVWVGEDLDELLDLRLKLTQVVPAG